MSSLIPNGGNDKVYTPKILAKAIVDHFKPSGRALEPCKGQGSFYDELSLRNDIFKLEYAEIDEGLDFFNITDKHYDWIVTNPPWSQFRTFLNHSMKLADNVVFISLINAFFMRARMRDMEENGFYISEILHIPNQPPKPWPQAGISLGATLIKRKRPGELVKDIKFSNLILNFEKNI